MILYILDFKYGDYIPFQCHDFSVMIANLMNEKQLTFTAIINGTRITL